MSPKVTIRRIVAARYPDIGVYVDIGSLPTGTVGERTECVSNPGAPRAHSGTAGQVDEICRKICCRRKRVICELSLYEKMKIEIGSILPESPA